MSERDLGAELRHRQQQKRATTTILVIVLMLFFAFWYAFSYYRASSEAKGTTDSATCTPYDPKVAVPANTTINVYNASKKDGLAARTAAQLRSRGFTVDKIANDSSGRTIKVAEVRHGPSGKSRAAIVTPLGGKGTAVVADKRKDASVDLVLGTGFTTLGPAPKPSGKPMCPAPSASATPSG